MATGVAKKKQQAVAKDELPDWMDAGSGRGSEDVTADDLVIPRLEIVQSMSPCRKKSDPAYIEGAEEGQLYNNVTRELYGEKVIVVPAVYRKEFLLWKDRDHGGGFGGSYPTMEEATHRRAEQDDPELWEIADTGQHFCLLVKPDGEVQEVVISMSKSKRKVDRQWNSIVRMNGKDRFCFKYELSTVEEEGKKGTYHNYKVRSLGLLGNDEQPLYEAAKSMYEAVTSGAKRADDSGLDDKEDASEY